jgi:peptide/nickel transport system substrate-binding protein
MTDTDNLSRRRFLQATGGAASAVALAGCTGDTGEETTEESAGNSTDETEQVAEDLDGTYLRLTNATMSTLDPIAATGTSEGQVIQQIHEPLMNYANATATVENRLATDYSVSDDLTTYTFELNEDATFHNGDDVTADDVVYSWERLAASDASKRAYFILDSIGVEHETTTETTDDGEEREVYKPGSLAVEAVDDYTVEMTISEPFHSVPEVIAYTSFAVIPEGIVGDIEGYDGEMEQGEFGKDPVGAGPFQFESWSPDTEAMVESFDDYHGTVPTVDGIHWNIVTDATARYNYAMNKNADYFPIPTNKFDPSKMSLDGGDANGGSSTLGSYGEIRNGETVNMVRTATIGNYYLGFNVEKVDKPVRQAFAYAANHQTLAEEVFKGTVKPASHFVPPAIFPGGATGYDEHAKDYRTAAPRPASTRPARSWKRPATARTTAPRSPSRPTSRRPSSKRPHACSGTSSPARTSTSPSTSRRSRRCASRGSTASSKCTPSGGSWTGPRRTTSSSCSTRPKPTPPRTPPSPTSTGRAPTRPGERPRPGRPSRTIPSRPTRPRRPATRPPSRWRRPTGRTSRC